MTGSQLALLDPDLHPRPGQQITLDFHGERIAGTVRSAAGNSIEVRPTSLSLLRQLHPASHLRALVVLRDGVCELVITNLRVNEAQGLLSGLIIGHPILVQRRATPRTSVRVDAGLVWLDPRTAAWVSADGYTENLSEGGAMLRFPDPPAAIPGPDCVALLGLRLTGRGWPMSLAVRVVQAWDEGARLRITDASPEAVERFRGFVRAQL